MSNIRLYGFKDCPYCKDIRTKFDDGDIDYVYVDIDLDKNIKEVEKIMELRKTESVPIILDNKT